jgi:predicted anti-sigma-YlaC factor YlaD
MMRWRRTTTCDRAAQWISLELDGELTELERAGLARHLDRCENCRRTSAELGTFTRLIRAAPLVELSAPVAVAGHRVRARRGAAVAALAASAAVAAVLVALPHTGGNPASGALGFRDAQQQRRFAQEHVRTELAVFLVAPTAEPAPSFALRALL